MLGTPVRTELQKRGAVTWLFGADRYETNLAVIKWFWPTGTLRLNVATGLDYPDALCAGASSAAAGQQVLLVGGRSLHPKARELLENEEGRIGTIHTIGGTGAIPYLMDWHIRKALAR